MSSRKTTILKELINAPEILVMPGVYDCLSAKIAEKIGFKAVQATGYGISASLLGFPDIGLTTMTEMLNHTKNMCDSVHIPIMADGDTGFGNALNLIRTVKEFEKAGAAGINLEDQVFPKRCGHMDGKQIISLEEAILKIEAAVSSRSDKDFVINARTDAIAVYGIEEAIKRGNAYAKAGADLIFVEAPFREEDIERVIKSIDAPVSINMTDGGKSPMLTVSKLEKWGAARVSFPVTALFGAYRGIFNILTQLKEKGTTRENPEMITSFEEFVDLIGLPAYRQLENQFLTSDVLMEKYK
ncbi:MAG: isocitrate lyase/PEP mutase family protein [Tissierellales bacterium]|nr:isocitrate lyase/PEP mutase family protein [Tissierellales bacterium]MBN2827927.1 isocitrate lyase/PEP mutase family protein [Tissierellales bacterium]